MKKIEIICPYCNKPYTAQMIVLLTESGGCDTCGDTSSADIKIYCSHCKKLVYSKTVYTSDDRRENLRATPYYDASYQAGKEVGLEEALVINQRDELLKKQIKTQQKLLEKYIKKYGQDPELYGRGGKLDEPTETQLRNRRK